MVLDVTTENLFCGGDWNYFQLQMTNIGIFEISLMIKNESLKYGPERDYMFLTINEGERTEIKEIDENSYEVNVNNCEIAPVADRLLLEAIVKYGEFNSDE